MKARAILLLPISVLLLLLFHPTVPAAACVPDDFDSRRCVVYRLSIVQATTAPTIVQNIVHGDSPSDALPIRNIWLTIAPNASVWYRTDDSPNFRALQIWLDASGYGNMTLAIFSPDQADGLSAATKPIGYGSFSKYVPYDLQWTSNYSRWGIWYALVKNGNAVPVSYRVGMNQDAKDTKNCISYWEYIGKDYVYWTNCNPNTWPP